MAKPEPPSFEDFSTRLRDARKAHDEGADGPPRGQSRQLGLAYRVAIEMAAGVAVGAGLGWALDGWLGTRPVAMAVLGLMGFAAGMLNAMRAARRLGDEAGDAGQGEDRRGRR